MYTLYLIVAFTVLGAAGIVLLLLFGGLASSLQVLGTYLVPGRRRAAKARRAQVEADGLGYYRYVK